MQTFRGGVRLRRAAAHALVLAAAALALPGPAAQAQEPTGATVVATLNLNDEGALEVHEEVTVPPGGDDFTMSIPLRVEIEPGIERIFEVTGAEATGAGETSEARELFTVTAHPGESTFDYTVHNTVADAPGSQVFQWAGMIGADIALLDVVLSSPDIRMGISKCEIGRSDGITDCAEIMIDNGLMQLVEKNISKGDSLNLELTLPPGTVPPNAEVNDKSSGEAFALSGPVIAAFGALAAGVLGMLGYVLLSRRRAAAAESGTDVFDPLVDEQGHVQFATPDGILPGEAGLLLDEQADPVDIAATVVDLAVRRYLWVEPIADNDWRIRRVNPPDEQLRDYERAVYAALLPDGTDAVTVSELRSPGRVDMAAISDALIADAVAAGTLIAPERRRLPVWLGAILLVVGALATIGLAATSGHALVGVAIALGGGACLLLPRFLPIRTARGDAVVRQVRALQRGMDTVSPGRVSPADQETVFSRGLPYTVINARTDSWIRGFRDLAPAADSRPGIYWFGGFERDPNLHRFAGRFPFFITSLEGIFADMLD